MPTSDLSGRVALVTGAGSGLGAAIAARLAADGAHVAVNDVHGASAREVAERIGGEAVPFDVTDPGAVDDAVDRLCADHGRLDIVVNNAGIMTNRPEVYARAAANLMGRLAGEEPQPIRAASTLTDEQWDRMIRVHLYGTFHGTRAALRHMEPVRRGAIVNVASVYGLQGAPGNAEYAAAKGGVVLFTRSVGAEVAPLGIRVNAVAPGFIDTPLLAPLPDEVRQMIGMRVGAGRFGRPEEVAEMVRFLAGDEASYCFGEVLTLTGAFG